MQDRIEKSIEINAPVERVWRALTDHNEFGEWFRANLDEPFKVGEVTRGQITYPGYEHLEWVAIIKKMEHERLFAFAWCPGSRDSDLDPSTEPQTLVEFKLEATRDGTRLLISESGFSALPSDRRADAFRENSKGWEEQAKNIAAYVET